MRWKSARASTRSWRAKPELRSEPVWAARWSRVTRAEWCRAQARPYTSRIRENIVRERSSSRTDWSRSPVSSRAWPR
ncbi:hypothetical protein STENM223S_02219 [Streptomyces tendae]